MDIRGKNNCTFSISAASASSITGQSYVAVSTSNKGYYYSEIYSGFDKFSDILDMGTLQAYETSMLYCERRIDINQGDRIQLSCEHYFVEDVIFEVVTKLPLDRDSCELFIKRLGRV